MLFIALALMSRLSEPQESLAVARQPARYYQKITETVLRWYFELEDGVIQADSGPVFDARILDYRLDVDAILAKFTMRERETVFLIHRDGKTHSEALLLTGLIAEAAPRWDKYRTVADIEIRMGQLFDKHRLGQFLEYVGYLR